MAVLGMVSAVSGFVKVRYLIDKAIIDNLVFRCHYRITCVILFLCCVIVATYNLIGDPISCIHDDAISRHVINTFCWITYTYTIPGQKSDLTKNTALYGLGNEYNREKRYHSYYQWVPFMLFFQGILFYMPHWIWKNWEDGKIKMITEGVRGILPTLSEQSLDRQQRIVRYIRDSMHTHNTYSFGYFLCETLNFINVIGNMFFIDKFLGGAFMTYGTEVIKFSSMNQDNRYDPMIQVFPRLTKCTFYKYGPGGSPQKHDTLCILALNIINEKIYIFLWFWFIILSILSICAITYSAIVVMLPSSRETIIRRIFRNGSSKEIETLVHRMDIGDFLILYLLGQNISMPIYNEMMHELCNSMGSNSDETPSAPSTLEMHPIYAQSGKCL